MSDLDRAKIMADHWNHSGQCDRDHLNGPRGDHCLTFRLAAETWPHYYSTYCIHDQHGRCRLVCKVCESSCLCGCHAQPEGEQ